MAVRMMADLLAGALQSKVWAWEAEGGAGVHGIHCCKSLTAFTPRVLSLGCCYAAQISDCSWEPSCCCCQLGLPWELLPPHHCVPWDLMFCLVSALRPTPTLPGLSCALELNTHGPSLAELNILTLHHWTVMESWKSSPGGSPQCDVCVPSKRLLPTPKPKRVTQGYRWLCLAAQHL